MRSAKKPSRAANKKRKHKAAAEDEVEYIGTHREYDDEDYEGPRTRGKHRRLVKKNQMRGQEVGIKKEPQPRTNKQHKDGEFLCPVCGWKHYADFGCNMMKCQNKSGHPDGQWVYFCGHCHTVSTNGGLTLNCDCESNFDRAARLRESVRPMEVFGSDDEDDDGMQNAFVSESSDMDSGRDSSAAPSGIALKTPYEGEATAANEGRTDLDSKSSPVIDQNPDIVSSSVYHEDTDTDTEENNSSQDVKLRGDLDDNQLQIKNELIVSGSSETDSDRLSFSFSAAASGIALKTPYKANIEAVEGEATATNEDITDLDSNSASPVIDQKPDIVSSLAYHKDTSTNTEERYSFQDVELRENLNDNQLQIKNELNKETERGMFCTNDSDTIEVDAQLYGRESSRYAKTFKMFLVNLWEFALTVESYNSVCEPQPQDALFLELSDDINRIANDFNRRNGERGATFHHRVTTEILSSAMAKGGVESEVESVVIRGELNESMCWVIPISAYDGIEQRLNELGTVKRKILKHYRDFAVAERERASKYKFEAPSIDAETLKLVPRRLRNKLTSRQREGVDFIISRQGRCLLGDETGIGKKIQAIASMSAFSNDWPLLVICQSSGTTNWKNKLLNWLGSNTNVKKDEGILELQDDNIKILTCGKDDVVKSESENVFICSYDMARTLVQNEKLTAGMFRAVIIDESHNFLDLGSPKTQQTKAISKIAEAAERLVLISGTPALSNPSQLNPQISLLLGANGNDSGKSSLTMYAGNKSKMRDANSNSLLEASEFDVMRKILMIRRFVDPRVEQVSQRHTLALNQALTGKKTETQIMCEQIFTLWPRQKNAHLSTDLKALLKKLLTSPNNETKAYEVIDVATFIWSEVCGVKSIKTVKQHEDPGFLSISRRLQRIALKEKNQKRKRDKSNGGGDSEAQICCKRGCGHQNELGS